MKCHSVIGYAKMMSHWRAPVKSIQYENLAGLQVEHIRKYGMLTFCSFDKVCEKNIVFEYQ